MSEAATGLDHVGVAARDLAVAAAQYERLGFLLTPLARHSGKRSPTGPVVPFGTGNRCVMLRRGYIELIAIVDPEAFRNTLDRFLSRYAGIHILALAVDDEDANLTRLKAAHADIPGVAYLERPVDDADPDGPRARFARLPLPDAPEGRIQLIRHLTPEAIWQERFLTHPNGATALEAVVLAVAQPAETAARFSRLAGLPVTPDPAGGFALALPQGGAVRILPHTALGDVLPGVAIPSLPFIAGMVIGTADRGAQAAAWLAQNGTAAAQGPLGLQVAPEDAGGAAVVFA